ncbi:hypothetical protein BJP36_13875 [Moorena producens JHB]|uniref:Uncharacterized protein n=2 Tax=Moorena TaxID=1155738 RepID=A0A1D9FZN1_MOOP1|nr:hypothetical protein [Moorena producens]AOY80838.2 hypothetical protein BJP36_13875 [Moorena producens JHB]
MNSSRVGILPARKYIESRVGILPARKSIQSRVGILPAPKYLETGKMPVLPRCQFYQDASSTKMPVLPRCRFYRCDPRANLILNAKLARCQFYQDADSTGATQGRFTRPLESAPTLTIIQ